MKNKKIDSSKMINEFPVFMYKLNENSDTQLRIVEKIKLSNNWITFEKEQVKLKPFIRTKTNEKGFIDYKQLVPSTNKIIFESWKSDNV